MREVVVDGSPAAVARLGRALGAALDGSGPAVLPVGGSAAGVAGPVPAGTALVVVTSGSTGEAKAVALSAAALRASAQRSHERLGGAGRWLLALPAHHVAGVQVVVRSILGGLEPGVVDLREGFRAWAFDEAARGMLRTTGPHYTAMVPTQLSRLLDEGGRTVREFDAVLVGGAATAPGLRERARAAGVNVVTTYGMTETAGGCVYDGVALAGVGVRITGAGLIELSGPTLAAGYLGRPRETAAAFVDGWFRTGDLGRLRADGTLEVLGRADDMINTGGVKVAAAAVERVLAAQPGVAEVCVLGLPDPEWGQRVVAAVVAGPVPPGEADLRAAVRDTLGAPAVPRQIRFVEGFPLRGPGKVDRAALAESF